MSNPKPYRALFFGAIGTLAETSELQREAFNLAFRQTGLDWEWDRNTYRDLLHRPGGVRRIADEAKRRGDFVDPEEAHARKVANFRAAVLRDGLAPRPGVVETMAEARAMGLRLGWITTTGRQTVELISDGLGAAISESMFDLVTVRGDVEDPKPAPDVYVLALERLGLDAGEVLAVEDTPESAAAARAAGIDTVGFPGWAAQGRAFPGSTRVVARLTPEILDLRATA